MGIIGNKPLSSYYSYPPYYNKNRPTVRGRAICC